MNFFVLLALLSSLTDTLARAQYAPDGLTTNGDAANCFQVPPARVTVLFFVAPDCPISNRYAPRINALASAYQAKGVGMHLVYADNALDAQTVSEHVKAMSRIPPAVLDDNFAVAEFAGATVTPEAVVFIYPEGVDQPLLVYRGRIDDQYQGFGQYRPAATRDDLRLILDQVLTGSIPEKLITTKAVGCYIPRP